MSEDAQAQEEELVALEAIYGEDCTVHADRKGCQVTIWFSDTSKLLISLHFPEAYPSEGPPLAAFSGRLLSPGQTEQLLQGLHDTYQRGETVIYNYVEWIKESAEVASLPAPLESQPETELQESNKNLPSGDWQAEQENAEIQASLWESTKKDAAEREVWASRIVHGEPFTETKSTFQGHLAPVYSSGDVKQVMAYLLENSKIQKATHNILAYRIITGTGASLQDCDDDGEHAAGGRLLHLLQIVDAQNVMVVVTRWYGGVHLGPARFTHINNAARMLLDQEGYIHKAGTPGKKQSK